MNNEELELLKIELQKTISTSIPGISLHFSNSKTNIEGSYRNGSITLYPNTILKVSCEQNWNPSDAFKVTLAHELGHASDPNLEQLYAQTVDTYNEWNEFCKEITKKGLWRKKEYDKFHDLLSDYATLHYTMENNARDLGRRFVESRILDLYEESNFLNLRNYYLEMERLKRVDKFMYLLRDRQDLNSSERLKLYNKKVEEVFTKVYKLKR